jgi:metallophosphoesterase (TIGR03767 family)
MGNHDELVQGNFKHTDLLRAQAVGSEKNVKVGGVRTVTPDPDRRLLSRAELVEEHFVTTGLPLGHGFTEENRANGTCYYTFDQGPVRFIVMDSVNENGGSNGSLDQAQFAWLQEQLTAAEGMLVVAASHHSSWTMGNSAAGPSGPRVLGPEVVAAFLQHDNFVAWFNGHTHSNDIRPHVREGGGGFWEINTASHIDWPQQSRLVELTDNKDGTVSIFTTMVDHGAPLRAGDLAGPMKLAALGRMLAANDWQERDNKRRGRRGARNAELLLPAPAFMT